MKKLTIFALVLFALAAAGCTEKTYIQSPTAPPEPISVRGSCFSEGLSIFCLDSSTGDIVAVLWAASRDGIIRTAVTGSPGTQSTLTVSEAGEYIVSQEVTAVDGSTVQGNDIPVTVTG